MQRKLSRSVQCSHAPSFSPSDSLHILISSYLHPPSFAVFLPVSHFSALQLPLCPTPFAMLRTLPRFLKKNNVNKIFTVTENNLHEMNLPILFRCLKLGDNVLRDVWNYFIYICEGVSAASVFTWTSRWSSLNPGVVDGRLLALVEDGITSPSYSSSSS